MGKVIFMATFLLAMYGAAEPSCFECWQRCTHCRNRCDGDAACAAQCDDTNAVCCETRGKKPYFKACGCF